MHFVPRRRQLLSFFLPASVRHVLYTQCPTQTPRMDVTLGRRENKGCCFCCCLLHPVRYVFINRDSASHSTQKSGGDFARILLYGRPHVDIVQARSIIVVVITIQKHHARWRQMRQRAYRVQVTTQKPAGNRKCGWIIFFPTTTSGPLRGFTFRNFWSR